MDHHHLDQIIKQENQENQEPILLNDSIAPSMPILSFTTEDDISFGDPTSKSTWTQVNMAPEVLETPSKPRSAPYMLTGASHTKPLRSLINQTTNMNCKPVPKVYPSPKNRTATITSTQALLMNPRPDIHPKLQSFLHHQPSDPTRNTNPITTPPYNIVFNNAIFDQSSGTTLHAHMNSSVKDPSQVGNRVMLIKYNDREEAVEVDMDVFGEFVCSLIHFLVSTWHKQYKLEMVDAPPNWKARFQKAGVVTPTNYERLARRIAVTINYIGVITNSGNKLPDPINMDIKTECNYLVALVTWDRAEGNVETMMAVVKTELATLQNKNSVSDIQKAMNNSKFG